MTSVVVVTGASSGIGRETALLLARQGHRVVAVARSKDALQALAEEAKKSGGVIDAAALDAAEGDAVLAMAARVMKDIGVPDAIVNCAGAGQWKFIEDTSPDEAKAMMSAPFHAAFNTTHAFMAAMLEKKRGIIIHVQSPAAIVPWPGGTGYASARWALRGLHEALSQDLIGTGVTSCHVIFGEVTSAYFDNNPGSHEYLPKIGKLVPRMTPAACAAVLVDVVKRPRRQVVAPFMLRAFLWLHVLAPWLIRWLMASTGRRHSPR